MGQVFGPWVGGGGLVGGRIRNLLVALTGEFYLRNRQLWAIAMHGNLGISLLLPMCEYAGRNQRSSSAQRGLGADPPV